VEVDPEEGAAKQFSDHLKRLVKLQGETAIKAIH
jgi:hypothetical protein